MADHIWKGDDYAKHSMAQYKWAMELIEHIPFNSNDTVLDIGCGDGKITAVLATNNPHGPVLGVDASENMLAEATKQFPPDQYPNLRYEKADASHLPFDQQFDVVFSNAALHWVKDHQPVLAGIYRALKPGGRCYLSFGGDGNGAKLFDAIHTIVDLPEWAPYFKQFEPIWAFHTAEDYREWLAEAKLNAQAVEITPKNAEFDSIDGLVGYLRTAWHQYNRYLPEDKINDFAVAVAEQYVTDNPPTNGVISVTMVRLEVVAERAH